MCTTSFVMPNDLSDLCRVCLQLPEESQYLDLTTIYDEEDNLTYGECFTICTQIDLSAGEGVPHHLCKTCGLELQMSYDFHKKIEESKRVIEQCQRQIQEQKENVADLLANHEESNKQNSQLEDESSLAQFINNKYIINEDEMELAVTSQELEEENEETIVHHENEENFHAANETNEETDELDILSKMCQNDITTNKDYPSLEMGNVTNITAEAEEHLDVEDYQNLEALEEEDLSHLMLCEEFIKCENEEIVTKTTITPYIPSGMRLPLPTGPPFICEFCGHSCKTKSLLASHRHRKHRKKDYPYECNKCAKSFNSKDLYDKHMKRLSCQHYPEFTCEYCSKKIIGSANYKIHLRFHKKIYPFECKICCKGFMMAVHLKDHTQTKHENKRYICEEPNCGKFFQSQQSLKNHMYVHIGSLPYCCEYCEKRYPNKGRLRWHIKSAHDFDISLKDLDRMLVSEEIQIISKAKTVDENY